MLATTPPSPAGYYSSHQQLRSSSDSSNINDYHHLYHQNNIYSNSPINTNAQAAISSFQDSTHTKEPTMEWSSLDCSRKRHPSDDLGEEQPLSKKLSLLHLNYGDFYGRKRRKPMGFQASQNQVPQFYIPPQQQQAPQSTTTVQTLASIPPPAAATQPSQTQPQQRVIEQIHTPSSSTQLPSAASPAQERMDVDNVVYISDLDTDSSDSEAEGKLRFHPEIQKKLSQIPYSIINKSASASSSSRATYNPTSSAPSTSTELILYKVPSSLSLPGEKDSVRRAIVEARERARRRKIEEEEERARREGGMDVEDERMMGGRQGGSTGPGMILTGVPRGWEDKQAYLMGGYYGGPVPMAGSVQDEGGQQYDDDDDAMEIE